MINLLPVFLFSFYVFCFLIFWFNYLNYIDFIDFFASILICKYGNFKYTIRICKPKKGEAFFL